MTDTAKPAYVILIRERMTDPAEFAAYGPKAREARGKRCWYCKRRYNNS